MSAMKRFLAGVTMGALFVAVFASMMGAATAPSAPPEGPEWTPLFNGKDLTGWTPKIRGYALGENYKDTFRVADGAIQVNYDGYEAFDDRFGHLFYQTPFSKYVLRLEYRFTGEQVAGGPGWAWRNSGVMVHGQDPKTMTLDQSFPVSAEIQFLGGDQEGERHTANLCTPGTHVVIDGQLVTRHCTDSTSDTYRGDRWVSVEIEVHGAGLVIHRVEGKEVMRYEQVQFDPNDPDAKRIMPEGSPLITGGTISLQSESHPVEFRNIRIKRLD